MVSFLFSVSGIAVCVLRRWLTSPAEAAGASPRVLGLIYTESYLQPRVGFGSRLNSRRKVVGDNRPEFVGDPPGSFPERLTSEGWLSAIRRDPQTVECVACTGQGGAMPLNLTAMRPRCLTSPAQIGTAGRPPAPPKELGLASDEIKACLGDLQHRQVASGRCRRVDGNPLRSEGRLQDRCMSVDHEERQTRALT